MSKFKKQWGIVIKAIIVTILLLGLKVLIVHFNLDALAIGPVVTALAAVFFVLAMILSSVLTDFKEAEKMLSELVSSVESLYKDGKLIDDEAQATSIQSHTKELLHAIIQNFERGKKWEMSEIHTSIDNIDNDIKCTAVAKSASPQLIMRMRTEISNINRICHRSGVIMETSFIPCAYAISDVATGGALLALLFAETNPYYQGLLLFVIISLILLSVVFLIRDLDNPFEGYATIDTNVLYQMKEYFTNK